MCAGCHSADSEAAADPPRFPLPLPGGRAEANQWLTETLIDFIYKAQFK